LIAQS